MFTQGTPAANLLPMIPQVHWDLVESAKQGNRQAFSDLFEVHGRHIYSVCLRLLGSVPAAELLTRDIFIEAFRNLDAISDDTAFAKWLDQLAGRSILASQRDAAGERSGEQVGSDRHLTLYGEQDLAIS